MRLGAYAIVTAAALAAGCVSQSQLLAQRQEEAVQTALSRARWDMNCPDDFIQPAVQGPWVAGLNRVEYTIGVAGCGQRRVLVVLCQEGTNTCFAASPDGRWRDQ
jgi:hypothetical protein